VPTDRPGGWPEQWRDRLPLYRIALALELHNWYTVSAQPDQLPTLHRLLRELVGGAESGN
jgi:hypothetical protein